MVRPVLSVRRCVWTRHFPLMWPLSVPQVSRFDKFGLGDFDVASVTRRTRRMSVSVSQVQPQSVRVPASVAVSLPCGCPFHACLCVAAAETRNGRGSDERRPNQPTPKLEQHPPTPQTTMTLPNPQPISAVNLLLHLDI